MDAANISKHLQAFNFFLKHLNDLAPEQRHTLLMQVSFLVQQLFAKNAQHQQAALFAIQIVSKLVALSSSAHVMAEQTEMLLNLVQKSTSSNMTRALFHALLQVPEHQPRIYTVLMGPMKKHLSAWDPGLRSSFLQLIVNNCVIPDATSAVLHTLHKYAADRDGRVRAV